MDRDEERTTWLEETRQGLDSLMQVATSARDELAEIKETVNERCRREDVKNTSRDGRCREIQEQLAKIIAERQHGGAGLDQTSPSDDGATYYRSLQQLRLGQRENRAVLEAFMQGKYISLHPRLIIEQKEILRLTKGTPEFNAIQQQNHDQIMAAVRGMRT
ncbi:hypothetical protein PHLCEN_2v13633 [Hermanssonia centrifuga]|uniref:Uncharacterized protein n=1 Tax=Hermanssonia centrifuga TaxID=98765 RepID=A0A2R6NEL8_9APHY|nr:hypothetical protein PHLCEN_2v13633 [Hermanssonia centrifuga]